MGRPECRGSAIGVHLWDASVDDPESNHETSTQGQAINSPGINELVELRSSEIRTTLAAGRRFRGFAIIRTGIKIFCSLQSTIQGSFRKPSGTTGIRVIL